MTGFAMGLGLGGFASPATAGLPQASLVGLWYAADYVATPRKAIKNTVNSSTALFSNYLQESTYANFDRFTFNNITKTYAYANGPTGNVNSATRLVGTGNCYLVPIGTVALVNGQTYTVAADVKSNTGSSQSFRQGNASGTISSLTATTSWQRFSTTFVWDGGGPVVFVWSPDGTTGWDLVVDNIAIFAGSSDLGRETLAGHMYFDKQQGSTETTNPATGVIDMASSGSGLVQFSSTLNLNAFTLSAVVKRTSATDSGYQAIFSDPASWTNFTAFLANGALVAQAQYAGNGANQVGPVYRNGSGWHVVTHRYDGTTYNIFVDGSKIFSRPITATLSVRNFLVGSLNDLGSFNSSGQFNAWAIYTAALTDAQVRTALVPSLLAKLQADGQSYASGRIVCAEGDSIITNAASFYVTATLQSGDWGLNFGVGGSTLANLVSRAATIDDVKPPGSTVKHVLGLLIGANDLATYTGGSDAAAAANYTTDLMAYIAARRSAGWKVVACTILPIGSGTAHNARRAIVNSNLRTQQGLGNIDALADFDTDAQMGIDNAYSAYPANWTDDVHPNATGHARLMTIFSTAANTI